jgi:hypothetical protein
MPSTFRTLAARAALTVCGLGLSAQMASAQNPIPDPPDQAEFFSRYEFTMSAARLTEDDDRFAWDTHWRGDFDLFDYKYGRMFWIGDYQALLGNEFRPFDPYQSNYLLEVGSSLRVRKTELAWVLNHVSRHLGDRPKRLAVAENSLGARVLQQFGTGTPTTLDLRLDARKVYAQAYVDYTGMFDVDLTLRRTLRPNTQLFGRAYGEIITVDQDVAGRDTQYGGRGEFGVRWTGTKGALELYGGVERVIDADPLDRLPRSWGFAGFRLLGY